MYYAQYISHSISLYLVMCLALARLYAVTSPLQYNQRKSAGSRHIAASIITAVLMGTLCATLNLVAVFTMKNTSVHTSCMLYIPDAVGEFLGLTAVVKMIVLLSIFLIPCIIILLSNIAIIVRLQKPTLMPRRSEVSRKLKKNMCILLLSALFTLCCLPKPMLDVHMALQVSWHGTEGGTGSDGRSPLHQPHNPRICHKHLHRHQLLIIKSFQ